MILLGLYIRESTELVKEQSGLSDEWSTASIDMTPRGESDTTRLNEHK